MGVLIGTVSGLFGAGGGLVAVPFLKSLGLSQRKAHANAVAVIFPIAVLSAVLYVLRGYVTVSDAMPYIPLGVLGSLIGAFILKKISPFYLKKVFAAFMIYAGFRLLVR